MFGIFKKEEIRPEIQKVIDSIDPQNWSIEHGLLTIRSVYYATYGASEITNKKYNISIRFHRFDVEGMRVGYTNIKLTEVEKDAISRKFCDLVNEVNAQEQQSALLKIDEMEL
jgi:hypothetical protein